MKGSSLLSSNSKPRIPPSLTLFLVLFVVAVGFGVIIPILPLITRAYGASPFALGAMTASYSVVQFVFSPIWGQISDRVGRKPILMVGIAGVSLSFVMMGLAQSFATLFWARVLGGLLSSATLPTAQALAAEISGVENRSKVMGLMGAAFGTGFVIGPVVGGALAPLGMSAPFFAAGILGTLTVILAALALREPQRDKGVAGDSDAMAGATERSTDQPSGLALVRNITEALRGPGSPYYVVTFVIMFTQSCLMTALAYFFADRFGLGPEGIGIVFGLNGACGAIIQGGAIGPITKRFGERRTIVIGLGIGAIGYIALVLSPTMVLAVGSVLLLAVSMSLTRPTVASALSKATTLAQGVTMGVQSSFDSLGRVIGPLWAGYTYELLQGAPFLSAAAVSLLALVYVRARTKPSGETLAT